MITMANLTGARLYITLDRKDNVKLVQSLIHSFTDTLCAICKGQKPSIKNIAKTFASETSKVENSSKTTKTLMWDVDTDNDRVMKSVVSYIIEKQVVPHLFGTKKGYHVFCYRKFNHTDWLDRCYRIYVALQRYGFTDEPMGKDEYKKLVSVKENELGLVYHPMKSCE